MEIMNNACTQIKKWEEDNRDITIIAPATSPETTAYTFIDLDLAKEMYSTNSDSEVDYSDGSTGAPLDSGCFDAVAIHPYGKKDLLATNEISAEIDGFREIVESWKGSDTNTPTPIFVTEYGFHRRKYMRVCSEDDEEVGSSYDDSVAGNTLTQGKGELYQAKLAMQQTALMLEKDVASAIWYSVFF